VPAVQPGPNFPAHRVVLAVFLNTLEISGGEVFYEASPGRLFASAELLARWNLRPGDTGQTDAAGQLFYSLDAIGGLHYSWDQAREELALTATPLAFLTSQLDAQAPRVVVPPYAPGGFLNYDVAVTSTPQAQDQSALLSAGAFGGESLFTQSLAVLDGRGVRLLSTYQSDQPDTLRSLRIGDSANATGAWGLGLLFGGVQWGTDFSVRPDFIAQSMPRIAGDALLPSTVDVLVNNVLRSRQEVPAGPFTIQNLPLVNGRGDIQVVVRDLLGREQAISQPFMASPSLLRVGLVQDAYEVGALRRNYGVQSDDYGDGFAAATYRKGLTTQWTGELRGELQKDVRTLGASSAILLPGLRSVIEATLAGSSASGLSAGGLTSVAYEHVGDRLAVNARLALQNASFRQLGSDIAHVPRQTITLQASAPLGAGTAFANYVQRQDQDESRVQVLNLNYAQRIQERVFFTVSLLQSLVGSGLSSDAHAPSVALQASFTVFFDGRHFSNAAMAQQAGLTSSALDYQQVAEPGGGVAYRLATLDGPGGGSQGAAVSTQQPFALLMGEVQRQQDGTSTRLSARGGLATLGSGTYHTQGLEQSFAIVRAGNAPGLPLFLENQLVAHTGADGTALIGNLRSFQPNALSLDPLDLPLDQSVGVVRAQVRPRRLGGVAVDLGVHALLGATLRLVLPDGSDMPPWTSVGLEGGAPAFSVGKDGEVYVELAHRGPSKLVARPAQQMACGFTLNLQANALPAIELPASDLAVPNLGTILCSALAP
jgi:outer membrane usher protein